MTGHGGDKPTAFALSVAHEDVGAAGRDFAAKLRPMRRSRSTAATPAIMAAVLLTGWTCGFAAGADAQTSARAQARARVAAGAALYQRGEYQQALEHFLAAHATYPSPKILFNIGQAHRGLGNRADAVAAFERFLAESGDGEAELRGYARGYLDELRLPTATAPPTPDAPAAAAPVAVAPSPAAAPAPAPPAAGPGRAARWWPWATAGLTAGLGAAALVTTISVRSRFRELERGCGQAPGGCPDGDIDNLRARERLQNALWGATALGAAATGVAFYLRPGEAGLSMAASF
jgi:tetratricopeptide (TPR) repeat protein